MRALVLCTSLSHAKCVVASNFGHDDKFFLCHLAFIDAGRQIAQYRMQALAVVEAGDVICHIELGFRMVRVIVLPDTLHPQVKKERSRCRYTAVLQLTDTSL